MVMMISHLFIVLYDLLFGLSDDTLQLMEPFFHLSESQASWLLLTADSLQKFLALFFCNARALLPLLDTLGQDLIDSTGKTKKLFRICLISYLIYNKYFQVYLAASFMPQSSEQYLELVRAASTHPGPRHCLAPPLSRTSGRSQCFTRSRCFCLGLCFRGLFSSFLWMKSPNVSFHSKHNDLL